MNMTPAEKLAAEKASGSKNANGRASWGKFICKIREERKKLGLSLGDVARVIRISPQGLSIIENGSSPSLYSAFRLAQFYGKTIEELWTPETR